MARFLDEELLNTLEEHWRRVGAGFVERLPAGLPDEEMDPLTERLGFRLPEEARRWYRWHDGSDGYDVTSYRMLHSLAEDVEQTTWLTGMDPYWRDGWLHVMSEKPCITFDCRVADDEPVPVWHYYQGFEFPPRPMFDSIGDMVLFWIELIDDGHLRWERGRGWRMREPVREDVLFRLGGVPAD
jgi:hypothetical protein